MNPLRFLSLLLFLNLTPSWADTPIIQRIPDAVSMQGQTYTFTPTLSNLANAGVVNWSKAYGPDEVSIDANNGAVVWRIADNLATESFHIGIKASNAQGYRVESWIVHVGVPKVVYIGATETYKTIVSAFNDTENKVPGMTFVVRNGSYGGQANAIQRNSRNGVEQLPVEGSAAAGFTTVMAEDPGRVVLTDLAATIKIMSTNRSYGYVAIKGFFSKGGSIGSVGLPTYNNCNAVKACRPHHLKFIGNGVESNGATPLSGFRSDYVLFENNYVFGGGRYKVAGYQSTHMVYRRNVARYDRSNNEMAEPKGTFSMYSDVNFVTNNNIAIDGDQQQFVTRGSIAGEYTCPTTNAGAIGLFERNIQLNSQYKFGNIDFQRDLCDAQLRDIVSWDVRPLGILYQSRSPSWLNHATMGAVVSRSDGALAEDYFNAWPSNFARGITNSVLHDFDASNASNGMFFGMKKQSNVALQLSTVPFATYEYPLTAQEIQNLHRSVERHGVDYVNISQSPSRLNSGGGSTIGGNITSVAPLYQRTSNPQGGLRYLVRIEPNSNLSGNANDLSDLGATVMTFKGRSGTLWGDTGYNDETNIPMWPFPMQDLIHEKMSAYRFTGPTYTGPPLSKVATGDTDTISGARGFAVPNQRLTHYIWNYIDNTAPPFNVKAIAGAGRALLKWDAPPSVAAISGYKVYDFDPATKALTNPRMLDAGSSFYMVNNLPTTGTYHFAVTAIGPLKNNGENGGESGYSYPATVTLSTAGADTEPPLVSNFQPSMAANVPADSSVSFNLVDIGSGVDISTLLLHINGERISPVVSGDSGNYTVSYRPETQFELGSRVAVSISVDDLSDNRLAASFEFVVANQADSDGICLPIKTNRGSIALVCL